ncbi:MAG TPA: response regulator [Desulfobulbus sp.]|nr:response regulator [Desulfobulbus sp.]
MNQNKEPAAQQQIAELESIIRSLREENGRLRKKASHADSANKAKSDFLAMISHEIRTPMNGVIGLSELLLGTDLETRQKHFAELILTSARNLLTLINSLLDFSKIEAKKMVLDLAPFDLTGMLMETMDLYALSGEQKELNVFADIDDRLAPSYIGDGYRIRQILVNLLGNAIKFTSRGEVSLKVTVVEKKRNIDIIRFEVKDTGPGIVREKQGELFQPFTQLDGPAKLRHGGTGLGLSICAKLIELMDGALGLNSAPGEGSTFWFQLRLPIAAAETSNADSAECLGGGAGADNSATEDGCPCTILIVDDEPTNRMVLRETLQRAGAGIIEAEDGRQAVEQCLEQDFDLIFMDCQMPVVDGFEATGQILTNAAENKRSIPPVIALTADATIDTRQRCQDTGMVDYLLKPLNFDELKQVIGRQLPDLQVHIQGRHVIDRDNDSEIKAGDMVINPKTLEKLGNNIGNLGPVINVFLQTLSGRFSDISRAVQAKDADAIAQAAHTLKGSSSQFGAEELAGLCRRMEDMGRSRNIAQAEPLLREIHRAAERLREELSRLGTKNTA